MSPAALKLRTRELRTRDPLTVVTHKLAVAHKPAPVFRITPVFSLPGMTCDPEQEMLSVVQLAGGKVIPVDVVPMKALKEKDPRKACRKLQAAFAAAHDDLKVTWRPATEREMAGWQITSDTVEPDGSVRSHHLDFVLEHFGQDKVDRVVRNRTRESAHQLLNLDLGPNYYSFMIQQMSPW